jgi:hypothetical protein
MRERERERSQNIVKQEFMKYVYSSTSNNIYHGNKYLTKRDKGKFQAVNNILVNWHISNGNNAGRRMR